MRPRMRTDRSRWREGFTRRGKREFCSISGREEWRLGVRGKFSLKPEREAPGCVSMRVRMERRCKAGDMASTA